jgi:uncharacterized protein with beta-barrel porin domain
MYARRRRRALLLSSSAMALLIGAGMPSAWAASCVHTISSGFDNPAAHTTANVCVQNTSFTGNIINEGTISPSGIALVNGTVTGSISSTGVINGGISIDKHSALTAAGTAILIAGPTFTGGISNAGTISAGFVGGIVVGGSGLLGGPLNISTFGGGITNSGTISASNGGGMEVGACACNGVVAISAFSGPMSNAGTITARDGILVAGKATAGGTMTISTFNGGVTNSGTVSAGRNGIWVGGRASSNGSTLTISTFGGAIANSGTITAGANGVFVGGSAALGGTLTISTFAGDISNSGIITHATANGVIVGGRATLGGLVSLSSFSGNITNSGAIRAGHGIVLGGLASSGGMVSISNFSGAISNSGTITAHTGSGILVGGRAAFTNSAVTISTFSNGVTNSGTITAHTNGIFVGGSALFGGVVSISNFSGGISNSGTIASHTGSGIMVGGVAALSNAAVTISTFSNGVTNSGTIAAGLNGILVGGTAGFGGLVSISNFSGAVTNSGSISSAVANGIMIGGAASLGSTVTIGTFAGGITNSGTINAAVDGVVVGGIAGLGSALSIGLFENDIVNAKGASITASTGILVGGSAALGSVLAVATVAGNIVNSGNISATGSGPGPVNGAGIWLGGEADLGSNLSIGTFTGAISNNLGATITGNVGILVGGEAAFGSSLTIGTFANGITNAGAIAAQNVGIWVGGVAAGGSTLAINTFMGGISNSGSISSGGAGIFVGGFSGTGSQVTISTFSGGITNTGTINAGFTGIALSNVSTFIGNIANRGTIVAGSVGISVCNCATFAGGSIVNTGSITAATGILVDNVAPVSIFDSGTIVGTGGTAVGLTTASGGNTFTLGPGYSITGKVVAFAGGNDTFQLGGVGSGSFDLSSVGASAQYENFANFNVISGIWTVFNTFGQSQAWNVDGGILAGTGTLAALNVNNGGTLLPGNIGTPGTATTITGNLNFQPGATYLINLDTTTASLTNVGGVASLNGAVEGLLGPGNYSGKTTYDILNAGSVTGTFTGFTLLNNLPGFAGTLTYLPTEVLLDLTAQLGVGDGLNTNQQNVANAINTAFNNGGTLPTSFFPLFTLTGNNLGNALTQLDGELNSDAERGAFQLMNQFLDLMLDPYVDGRTDGGGGGGLGFAPDQQASFPSDVALAYDAILKAPPKGTFDQRWSIWGSGFGGTSKADGDPPVGSRTVTASDYGFAAGMDYRISPDTVVGFSLGGGGTGWNLAQAIGTGRSDSFLAGAYGITHWGPAYLAGALGFANHWFSTNRVALGDQITASFVGQSYAARAEGGYRYALPFPASGALGLAGVTPYAALQTQWFQTPTYSETDLGGGGFGLTYNAMTANDIRSELGARFDDLVTLYGTPLILRGRVAWAHDWVSNPALNAVFQALPGAAFTVNGAPMPQNSALTTASAELRFTPRWSLTGQFDGEIASGSQTYAGTGTLRYTW